MKAPDGAVRPRAKSQDERQRHPTEVRRRLVIAAARDLIADHGLLNVKIRDISTACEVSPGTITYHFQGLEEILWEVVKAETVDFYQPLEASVRETALTDPAEALAMLMRGLFKPDLDTRRHWRIWLEFWAAASRDDSYGEWMNSHYEEWRGGLRDLAERGLEQGVFTCEDPTAFAIETAALVDGLAAQCYSRKARLSVEEAREQLLRSVYTRLGLEQLTPSS